jgi:hypothetical protein
LTAKSAPAAGIFILAVLAGCSAERRELSRQISPNQKLVAVLMESAAGSTEGSLHEDIYLNDQGLPLNFDKPAFSATGSLRDYLRHQSFHQSLV